MVILEKGLLCVKLCPWDMAVFLVCAVGMLVHVCYEALCVWERLDWTTGSLAIPIVVFHRGPERYGDRV